MQAPETLSKSASHKPPTLALIGASVRAAAQSARRGGYRVIGIDLFGDTDTRESCDKFHLVAPDSPAMALRILDAIRGTPVLPVGGLTLLPAGLPLSLGNGEVAEAWRRFDDLEEFADHETIRFPEISNTRVPPLRGRWLRKQIDGCGGLGTRWATADDRASGTQLQRWVRGRPFGATMMHDGCHTELIGACRSIVHRIGPFPFVYGGSIGPAPLPPRVKEGITRFAKRVAQTRRIRGLFNVDFILDSQQRAWILEVNPRWTASMELIERQLRTTDRQLSLIAAAVRGQRQQLDAQNWQSLRGGEGSMYVKRVHFASRPITFDHDHWESRRQPGQSLHDVPADGKRIGAGQPICTVIERIDRGEEKA